MSKQVVRQRRPWSFEGYILISGVAYYVGSGAPTDGVTGANEANPGSHYINKVTGIDYQNTNTLASPTWTPVGTVTAGSVGTTELADGGVTPAKLWTAAADGLGALRVARATFDPSLTSGSRTIAAHGLGVTIPSGAVVVGGFVNVITTCADGASDNATIALKVEGANDLVSAIAISDVSNPWDAGLHALIPKANTPESTGIVLTADREITATVAVHALTAGKFVVHVYFAL